MILLGVGAVLKLADDLLDMYESTPYTSYALEVLKITMTYLLLSLFTAAPSNIYMYLAFLYSTLGGLLLYDRHMVSAYWGEPYFAALSSVMLTASTFKVLKYYRKANPVCAAVLTFGMYQAAAPLAWSEFDRSGSSKSPFNLLNDYARQHLPPSVLSYIMLAPNVEYSELKLQHRLVSAAVCAFLVFKGNSLLLNAFKIRDPDAVDALNGWVAVILGYSIISVINQANMLYWQTEDKVDTPEDNAEASEDNAETPEDERRYR